MYTVSRTRRNTFTLGSADISSRRKVGDEEEDHETDQNTPISPEMRPAVVEGLRNVFRTGDKIVPGLPTNHRANMLSARHVSIPWT
jgi:hypothetical protein